MFQFYMMYIKGYYYCYIYIYTYIYFSSFTLISFYIKYFPKLSSSLGLIYYCDLNNSFQYLNNITRIFTLFHQPVFLKNTNNIIKNLLPNQPLISWSNQK